MTNPFTDTSAQIPWTVFQVIFANLRNMAPKILLALLLPALAAAHSNMLAVGLHREHRARPRHLAMVIPPDNVPAEFLLDGSMNFLSIYSGIITFRILLSWVPQAQGVALLRPIFTVSDAYLNLFRGVIPAIGGLDISPIAAFFVLNLLTTSVGSLGAPVEPMQPSVGLASRMQSGAKAAAASAREEWTKRLIA